MAKTIFRIRTALQTVGVVAPTVITPTIAEPVNWDQLPINGEADPKTYGYSVHYGDGELKLVFTCESGEQILSHQYNTYGVDALVEFLVVKVARDGSERVRFFGRLDYETIDIQKGRISVSVIQNSQQQRINANYDTPVDMSAQTTFDDQSIIPPATITVPLNGQTIHETGEIHRQVTYSEHKIFDNTPLGGVFYLLPNFIQPAKELVNQTTTIPALSSLSGVGALYGDVWQATVIAPIPLLTVETAGKHSVEIDWLFRVFIALTSASVLYKAKFGRVRLQPTFLIKYPTEPDQNIPLAPEENGDGFTNSVEYLINANFKASFDLPIGAQVFLLCLMPVFPAHELRQIEFSIETNNLRVKIERNTRAIATNTLGYLLPTALRHIIGVNTSSIDPLTKSGILHGELVSFASNIQVANGEATDFAVASGNQIRRQPKIPSYSFKTLFETLQAQCWAGIFYEQDQYTGVETMRIERADWFTQENLIWSFDQVYDYHEEPDLTLLYNVINVGYEKYPDSGPGVADEFNTEHTYKTPLIYRDATLTIKSALIGAGTAVEIERRLGIDRIDANGVVVSTASDSGSYDEDGFILHVQEKGYVDQVWFKSYDAQPFPGVPYESHYVALAQKSSNRGLQIRRGDTIHFTGTGTANDGVYFTVMAESSDGYEVRPETPFISTVTFHACEFFVNGQGYQMRTNERLTVTGITDPGSAYNLELTPARMLLRHGLEVNSGLAYHKKTDVLRCTAFKLNASVTSQVIASVAPLSGDPDKQFLRETADLSLGSIQGFNKQSLPDKITCKVQVSEDVYELIENALLNRGDQTKLRGYLRVLNSDGDYVNGTVRSHSYNRKSETLSLVLRKKTSALDPNADNCRNYYDKNFAYFENNQAADPNVYRFCRFRDFRSA